MSSARDRNVYVLGAGFSASAGVPVVHDFIDHARTYFDDPSSGLDQSELEHFEKFFAFKRKMSQAREKVRIDLDNIEQLFGLVEISDRLQPERRKRDDTRTSTVYTIAKTIQLAAESARTDQITFTVNDEVLARKGRLPHGFNHPPAPVNPPIRYGAALYDYFAGLAAGLLDDPDKLGNRANSFITFNYDLVLDDALRRVGVVPDYQLPTDYLSRETAMTNGPSCPVLKLHGSTNWGICANCQKQVVVLEGKVTAVPSEFRSRECQDCRQKTFQPLLIPPSWDKSEHREIMRPVWQKAVEELKRATRICVIGYSMPEADSFFKYLLALALSENHGLYKFIVVDKDQTVSSKYEQLLDPMFRERRIAPFLNEIGFSAFLGNDASLKALGRGEVVWGNLRRS
jgi:hypothetical protein